MNTTGNTLIAQLLSKGMLPPYEPASEDTLAACERQFGLTLPPNLKAILLHSDGGPLRTETSYGIVEFFTAEQLSTLNEHYPEDCVDGALNFASDGAGYAYALDTTRTPFGVIGYDLYSASSHDDVDVIAASFDEFLSILLGSVAESKPSSE